MPGRACALLREAQIIPRLFSELCIVPNFLPTCMKGEPLVSVIVPLFNREHLIGPTISSVLSQGYTHVELIVVDDGSTDGGPDVVREFAKLDRRCRLIERGSAPHGAPACRNIGYENSKGDLIIFLDSDDLLASGAIEGRVDYLLSRPDCDFSVSQCLLFRETPGDCRILWNRCDYSVENLSERFLDQDMPFQTTGPTWRRDAVRRLGPWLECLSCWQDWEYHLRACVLDLKLGVCQRPDFFLRRSDAVPQISKFHNEAIHVQSRFRALEAAIQFFSSRNQLKGSVRIAARGLLLRNYLSLVDAGLPDLALQLLNLRCAKQLLWSVDRFVLQWVLSHGDTWHWNRRVRRVTRFWWRNLKFDSLNVKNDFMRTEWTGEMPKMGSE